MSFLRWTGAKKWFVRNHLNQVLPKAFNNFHEPFLGGGSVFFSIAKSNCERRDFFLSDTNSELINTYSQIKSNPYLIIECLKDYINSENEYYLIRDSRPTCKIEQAARFIFLNKTSFNGIYRVNKSGVYNVPYGKNPNAKFLNELEILTANECLKSASIFECDFTQTIENIKKGDLVFLDPPYTVAHENNGFIEYNQHLFKWSDQENLKNYVTEIKRIGAYFVMTNASHKSILDLYGDVATIQRVSRHSPIGSKLSSRGNYNELIITNTV